MPILMNVNDPPKRVDKGGRDKTRETVSVKETHTKAKHRLPGKS